MMGIFALTILGSAFLLFLVQPMIARMILPLLGGVPAVWNTTQLFCQGGLLAGYLYAHISSRLLHTRCRIILHIALMLAALFVLPFCIPPGRTPPAETNPIGWLIALLGTTIGLPFFVLSSSSPLLQRWFAYLRHANSSDPYFLYVASNVGSMTALLTYPAVVEPWLQLQEQARYWKLAYFLLIALIGCSAAFLWRARQGTVAPEIPEGPVPRGTPERNDDAAIPRQAFLPTLKSRFRWLFLAFIPSSMMLSVTTYLTTDIASVPLLWIIPLALYLLTFVLAFARKQFIPHHLLLRVMPLLLLPLSIALACRGLDPIWLAIPLHLIVFFVVGMVCHGKLVLERPPVEYLTEFYIFLSIGGLLGGLFNALVAPLLFGSVAEYPIVLAASCLVLPQSVRRQPSPISRIMDILLPLSLTAATILLVVKVQQWDLRSVPFERALMFGIPAIICFSFSRHPWRFALGVGGILIAGNFYSAGQGRVLYAERSFFGVSRVTIDPMGKFHQYMNGTTMHGSQSLNSALKREPTTYYHRTGPLGQFFEAIGNAEEVRSVAVVGLGVGTILSYAQSGQRWTYYEIDPAVVRIARDSGFFSYIRDCPAMLEIVLGDGRLKLSGASDGIYDVLILDAYSSDSVPVHLIDREALELYFKKIKAHGRLLFHVSNRYLDIEPVIGNLAKDGGWYAFSQSDNVITQAEEDNGKTPSGYVAVARTKQDLAPLLQNGRWLPARTRPDLGVWTDSYSSIVKLLK